MSQARPVRAAPGSAFPPMRGVTGSLRPQQDGRNRHFEEKTETDLDTMAERQIQNYWNVFVFQNVVAQNKFAFLQEEEGAAGSSDEN